MPYIYIYIYIYIKWETDRQTDGQRSRNSEYFLNYGTVCSISKPSSLSGCYRPQQWSIPALWQNLNARSIIGCYARLDLRLAPKKDPPALNLISRHSWQPLATDEMLVTVFHIYYCKSRTSASCAPFSC